VLLIGLQQELINPVHLGNHWLSSDGEMIQQDQARVDLSQDLEPNNEEIS
jgi:hypothetical protein